jgi:hypothetical protein
VDSRLRRSPPDRASAVPYGQAGENAMRFPHLAHRSAAAHKLHSATATTRYEFDSGKSETISRLPALAYSPRKLSKRPGPSQTIRHAVPFCAVAEPDYRKLMPLFATASAAVTVLLEFGSLLE